MAFYVPLLEYPQLGVRFFTFGVVIPILTLDCRHGLDGMYTTDRLHACFRQTEVLDLAFGDQLLDGTSHIFDRHFRINAVLVEDVDTIGPQTI